MTSSASYRQTECSASQRTVSEFTVIAELPVFVSSEGVAAPQALCPVIFLTLPVFVWMERRHTAVATEIGSNAHHTYAEVL